MHPCLRVQEIIREVVQHVVAVEYGLNHSRVALHAMVLTCKAFHEPALDGLWRALNRLDDLVKCLPRETWGFDAWGHLVRDSSLCTFMISYLEPIRA